MNWVDVVLGVVLLLAFSKGFAAGVWKSLFSLVATALAFVGAALCTGPSVSFVESQWGFVGTLSAWLEGAFSSLPAARQPYDGSLFAGFGDDPSGPAWINVVNSVLRKNLAPGLPAGTTWGAVLSTFLAHLVVSGAVFLVLLAAFRMLTRSFVRWLPFESPASFSARAMGGLVQSAISLLWLALVTGTLYPMFVAGWWPLLADQVTSSWIAAVLLQLYEVLWPAVWASVSGHP